MPLIYTASIVEAGLNDRRLRRQCELGLLVRIRPGAFVPVDEWARLDGLGRYRLIIRAAMRVVRPDLVASHDSAAALWGFPVLDAWPSKVHVLDAERRSTKTSAGLVKHPGQAVVPSVVDSLALTPAARTASDLVLARGFLPGLLGLDFGLATGLFSRGEVAAELAARANARGSSTARIALGLADAGAQSALETISRADIYVNRFPQPELQKKLVGADGRTYYVDFWWPQFGLIGESDGEEKYRNARMRGPRSLEQVLLDEKARDDALRARPDVKNLVRWRYKTARQPGALAALLAAAGLPHLAR